MKKYIYIPALSAGYLFHGIINNQQFKDGSMMDFYNYENEFKYPYFLITAGHHYKKNYYEAAKFFKNPDTEIFGDSGGFQIAKGTIKWDINIRNQIFNWLENNSTIAANIDIPIVTKTFNNDECLKISKDNFKYFHENQSGKTKFLNVIQGHNVDSYKYWYNAVKDFKDFKGWCVGNSGNSVSNLIDSLFVLVTNNELERSNFIHYLGASSVPHMILLAHIQNAINKLGLNVQMYSDSSTPNASRFGYYYYDIDYRTLVWRYLHVPYIRVKTPEEINNLTAQFLEIYNTPTELALPPANRFDKIKFMTLFDHSDMIDYNSRFCSALILHNTLYFRDVVSSMNRLVTYPEYYRETIFNKDIAALGTFVEKLILSHDSIEECTRLYSKYSKVIHKFKNSSSDKFESKNHDFF